MQRRLRCGAEIISLPGRNPEAADERMDLGREVILVSPAVRIVATEIAEA
jgi:hypothetical protein